MTVIKEPLPLEVAQQVDSKLNTPDSKKILELLEELPSVLEKRREEERKQREEEREKERYDNACSDSIQSGKLSELRFTKTISGLTLSEASILDIIVFSGYTNMLEKFRKTHDDLS